MLILLQALLAPPQTTIAVGVCKLTAAQALRQQLVAVIL